MIQLTPSGVLKMNWTPRNVVTFESESYQKGEKIGVGTCRCDAQKLCCVFEIMQGRTTNAEILGHGVQTARLRPTV